MTWEILPWQQRVWRRLMERKGQERVPHALLISGPPGIGKVALANALAAALLCERSAGDACGECAGCRQFRAGAHSDFTRWEPEEDAVSLKIDQIREMTRTLFLTRGRAPYKVCVLHPADALTHGAADSLLKTLEEPPPQTVLMLVSHLPEQLSATIRSRCQQVRLAPCYDEPAVGWLAGRGTAPAPAKRLLAVSGGAPLRAAAMLAEGALEEGRRVAAELRELSARQRDPVTVAERWAKAGLAGVLPWIQGAVQDAIRRCFAPDGDSVRYGDTDGRGSSLSFSNDLALLFEINARLIRLSESVAQRHSVSQNSLAEQIAVPIYRGGKRQ